jgi:mannose-6-phosphate isomerase-like protein (cupin superfamily)
MQAFDLDKLLEERASAQHPWLEFLRVKALSVGVYHLNAGQADPQMPHTEYEVYYVISGRAQFRAGQRQVDVRPGSVIFVERAAEHRFLDVAEDLTVLVFFAPPEGSLK